MTFQITPLTMNGKPILIDRPETDREAVLNDLGAGLQVSVWLNPDMPDETIITAYPDGDTVHIHDDSHTFHHRYTDVDAALDAMAAFAPMSEWADSHD